MHVAANYSENFWHPMVHPNVVKQRAAIHIVSGDGVFVKDDRGETLLDAVAGLWCVNVGHNRVEVKNAIKEQLDELEYFQLFDGVSHPRAVELAELILDIARDEDMARVSSTARVDRTPTRPRLRLLGSTTGSTVSRSAASSSHSSRAITALTSAPPRSTATTSSAGTTSP